MKSILIVVASLFVIQMQASMLLLDPIRFVKEYFEVLHLVEDLDAKRLAESPHKTGPLVGNIWTDIVRNFQNLINDFSYENVIASLIDFSSYIFMPLAGGYQACEAHMKYQEDEPAYRDGGVTEEYLFKQSGNMFKEQFWEFFGLFSRVAQNAYAKTVSEYNEKVQIYRDAQKLLDPEQEFMQEVPSIPT